MHAVLETLEMTQNPSPALGGLAEPPAPPWAEAALHADGARPVAAAHLSLRDSDFESRFCTWKGRSGRGYVFSVFAPRACPAYCRAALLIVGRDAEGRRRVMDSFDTGVFPEPIVERARRSPFAKVDGAEFHVHLLAATNDERRAVLRDLGRS